jgi:hypothetical protein
VARDERRTARREEAARRREVPRNEVASGRDEVSRNEVASGPGGGAEPPSEPTLVPAPHVNETVGPTPAPDPAATEFGFEGG